MHIIFPRRGIEPCPLGSKSCTLPRRNNSQSVPQGSTSVLYTHDTYTRWHVYDDLFCNEVMIISSTTSKFHREFMSPALFLFELLKISKLTRGPLVLYHLPK